MLIFLLLLAVALALLIAAIALRTARTYRLLLGDAFDREVRLEQLVEDPTADPSASECSSRGR